MPRDRERPVARWDCPAVCRHTACHIVAIENGRELAAVITRVIDHDEAAYEAACPIDPNMTLVTRHPRRDLTRPDIAPCGAVGSPLPIQRERG